MEKERIRLPVCSWYNYQCIKFEFFEKKKAYENYK